MKRVLISFLLGLAVGAGGLWYLQQRQGQDRLHQAQDKFREGAGKIKEAVSDVVNEFKPDEIKKELERTGTVVREKARKAGAAISDAASNARITASVKTRLIAEPGLSALSINVDTTDGLVTLSGTAASPEQIAKAVRVALDTDGVHKVISTLQVK